MFSMRLFPKFGPKDSYDLVALRTEFSVSELKRHHEIIF